MLPDNAVTHHPGCSTAGIRNLGGNVSFREGNRQANLWPATEF